VDRYTHIGRLWKSLLKIVVGHIAPLLQRERGRRLTRERHIGIVVVGAHASRVAARQRFGERGASRRALQLTVLVVGQLGEVCGRAIVLGNRRVNLVVERMHVDRLRVNVKHVLGGAAIVVRVHLDHGELLLVDKLVLAGRTRAAGHLFDRRQTLQQICDVAARRQRRRERQIAIVVVGRRTTGAFEKASRRSRTAIADRGNAQHRLELVGCRRHVGRPRDAGTCKHIERIHTRRESHNGHRRLRNEARRDARRIEREIGSSGGHCMRCERWRRMKIIASRHSRQRRQWHCGEIHI
jgi:hypothetical protein